MGGLECGRAGLLVVCRRTLLSPLILLVYKEGFRCCGGQEGEADFEARCDVATAHSTFEWMSSHGQLFDEHVSKHSRNQAMGLPRDAGTHNTKVRAGEVRSGFYWILVDLFTMSGKGVQASRHGHRVERWSCNGSLLAYAFWCESSFIELWIDPDGLCGDRWASRRACCRRSWLRT